MPPPPVPQTEVVLPKKTLQMSQSTLALPHKGESMGFMSFGGLSHGSRMESDEGLRLGGTPDAT